MDFGELDELVDRLEGHAGVVVDLVVVDHLIHVVRRDWTDDVFALLVVPDLSILVQSSLVKLVEQSEGTWLIVLFLLLAYLDLLAVFRFSD